MTPPQHEKLFEIFQRPLHNSTEIREFNYYTRETWEAFLSRADTAFGDTVIMIEWQGMWLGIETDGHCHS